MSVPHLIPRDDVIDHEPSLNCPCGPVRHGRNPDDSDVVLKVDEWLVGNTTSPAPVTVYID
jgi:hypothetical protein